MEKVSIGIGIFEMNTYQAYQLQIQRLTENQKAELNLHESRIGRQLSCWEIVKIFNLGPSEEKRVAKRRLSDEVDQQHWADQ